MSESKESASGLPAFLLLAVACIVAGGLAGGGVLLALPGETVGAAGPLVAGVAGAAAAFVLFVLVGIMLAKRDAANDNPADPPSGN